MADNTPGIKKDGLGIFFVKLISLIFAFIICWQFAVHTAMVAYTSLTGEVRKSITNYISEFGKTHLDKKLVVLTQDVTVEISKEIDNRILWDWVSVGSANSKFKFIDNKVQYYVPLSEIKDDSIFYDPQTRTVKIISPKVRIDKDMVSVQSDPTKVIKEENGSWSPFGPSLKDLSNEIMAEVKEVVIREGYHQFIRDKAQAEAQKAVEDFFNAALSELIKKENVNLQIILP